MPFFTRAGGTTNLTA
jgi:hypothetical protein